MGSFNVACSVSNISIGCGTDIVYIPLLPNVFSRASFKDSQNEQRLSKLSVEHFVGQNSDLSYPYCYYLPFSLPIRGKYDDYGGVENIVEDANTKTLEKFFGLDIETLLGLFTHLDAEEKFAIYKFQYRSDAKLTPSIITSAGLTEEKIESSVSEFDTMPETLKDASRTFYHPKFPEFKIVLTNPALDDEEHDFGNFNFKIQKNDQILFSNLNNEHGAWSTLLKEFKKLTNFIINIPEDKQLIVQILNNLSGMFIHAKIYDALANNIISNAYSNPKVVSDTFVKKDQLLKLGFKRVSEEQQWVIDSHHNKLYRKQGFKFDVKIGSYGGVIVPTADKEYAKLGDKRFVKETRNIWKKYTRTDPDNTFPEPETSTATDTEWKAICDKFEELTGVRPGYSKNSSSFFCLSTFKKQWQERTNNILDITQYDKKDVTDDEYDDIQAAIIKFEKKKKLPSTFETHYYPSIKQQKDNYNKLVSTYRILGEEAEPFVEHVPGEAYQVEITPYNDYFDNPFNYMRIDTFKLLQFFKDWDYFKELYYTPILNNELRQQIKTYRNFYYGMYSTNNFFFPAMNGEQCGDAQASKVLYETSLNIINEQLHKEDI